MTHSTIFQKSFFLVIILLLQSCSPAPKTISVGAAPWPNNEYLFIADKLDLFPVSLISVFELPSSTNVLQAIQTGKLDVAFLTLDQVLTLKEQDTDLKIISVLDNIENPDLLISSKPLTFPADFSGRTIGFSNKTSNAFLASEIMEISLLKNKLPIKFKEVKQNTSVNKFNNNDIDALIISKAQWPIYKKRGAYQITLNEGVTFKQPITNHVIAVRTRVYEENKAALELLLKGYYQASEEYQKELRSSTEIKQTEQMIALRLGLSRNLVQQTFAGIKHLNSTQAKIIMSGNPSSLSLSMLSLGQLMLKNKMLKKGSNPADLQSIIATDILGALK